VVVDRTLGLLRKVPPGFWFLVWGLGFRDLRGKVPAEVRGLVEAVGREVDAVEPRGHGDILEGHVRILVPILFEARSDLLVGLGCRV
jgi:hypothetical protein